MDILESNNIFYDTETTNLTFLQVANDLRRLGIKNNKFFLRLNDKGLQGIDPHGPLVYKSEELVYRIINECMNNIWYYLREVAMIADQGNNKGARYKLSRGNLAATWCFINSISHYFGMPRQCGKTQSEISNILWAYLFGITNSEMSFFAIDQDLTSVNLNRLKTQRSLLPTYLQLNEEVVIDEILGTKDRAVDNVRKVYNPMTKNTIYTKGKASTKDKAVTMGRGLSLPIYWFDEFDFMDYVDEIVMAAGPSFITASDNAIANNSIACRIMTSTPGDLDSAAGKASMTIINKMCRWSEKWYDMGPEKAKEIIEKNSEIGITEIKYSYQQLGKDDAWFRKQCMSVGYDEIKIRREILLQRIRGSSDSPFSQEDLMALQEKTLTIIDEILISDYRIDIYRTLNPEIPYLVGVDVASGIDSDNTAITITNPYTLQADAEFKSPCIGTYDLKRLLYTLIRKYLPKSLLCIERNHCGDAVIDELWNTQIRRNIFYNEKKDLIDNGALKVDHGREITEPEKRRLRGVWTGKNSRQLMMDLLMVTVQEHKERISSTFLLNDILALVIKNGKIQAGAGEHDDNVMSYLITLYVYTYAKNLKRWGIVKGMKEPKSYDNDDSQERDAFEYLEQLSPNDAEIFRQQHEVKNSDEYYKQLSTEIYKSLLETEKMDEYTKTTKYVKDIDYEENQYELENDGFRSTNSSSLDFFDDLNEW